MLFRSYILECKNKIESGSKKLYFDPFDEPPSGINVSDYYLKPVYVINIDPKQFTCCDCKQKFSADGWMSSYRHIHCLKTSCYLLQKNYKCGCNNSQTGKKRKIAGHQLVCSKSTPLFLKVLYPFYDTGKAMIHNEIITLLVHDATTGKSFEEIGSTICSYRLHEYAAKRTLFVMTTADASSSSAVTNLEEPASSDINQIFPISSNMNSNRSNMTTSNANTNNTTYSSEDLATVQLQTAPKGLIFSDVEKAIYNSLLASYGSSGSISWSNFQNAFIEKCKTAKLNDSQSIVYLRTTNQLKERYKTIKDKHKQATAKASDKSKIIDQYFKN